MWPYVDLSGYSHTIPYVCPNCLAEAHEPVVCYHKDLFSCFWYPFGPAEQTFFYCDACAEQARAGVRCDRLRRFFVWMFPLLAIGFAVGGFMILLIGPGAPLHEYWDPVPGLVKLGVFLVGVAFIWWLIVGGYKRSQRRRYPKTEAQAVWGVASYYTAFSNYKAARPEWIEALVRCNPGTLKDKVYRRITGEEKPE